MIKSALIQKIAARHQHLYHRDIERIVNVVLNEIVEALARGDRVELRDFGAFTVRHRAPARAAIRAPVRRCRWRKIRAVLQGRQGPARAPQRQEALNCRAATAPFRLDVIWSPFPRLKGRIGRTNPAHRTPGRSTIGGRRCDPPFGGRPQWTSC